MFSIPEDVVLVVPDVGVVLAEVVLGEAVLGEVVLGVIVVVEEDTGIDGVGVGRLIANKDVNILYCLLIIYNTYM